MTGRRSLHPDDEERFVADMTRELETLGATSSVLPEAGFSDRVMASIGVQPLPQPARAFGVALLAGRVRAAASAVGDAWRVSFGGFAPAFVRAQALALVLLVGLLSIGVVGGGVAAAAALVRSGPTPSPSLLTPSPSISPMPSVVPAPAVAPTSSPDPSAEASGTVEPSDTPEATDRAGSGSEPQTPSPKATSTDDHGGGSGSGGSGSGSDGSSGGSGSGSDSSGSGSGGGDHGATPTPAATGTDDHGGSGDG